MANAVRVRVELRESRGRNDSYREFLNLLTLFNRRVNEAGIASEWKRHQYYESKGQKKRRKKKERDLELQKQKLRDYFGDNRGK